MICSPPGVFEAVHQRDIRGGGGHLLPQRPRGAGGHERDQHHQPHDGAVQQDRQVRDGACTVYNIIEFLISILTFIQVKCEIGLLFVAKVFTDSDKDIGQRHL